MSSVIEEMKDIDNAVTLSHEQRIDGTLGSAANIEGLLHSLKGNPADGIVLTDVYTFVCETDRAIDYDDKLSGGGYDYKIEDIHYHDNQKLFNPFYKLILKRSKTV